MKCPKCSQDFRPNDDKPLVVVGVPCLDAVLHYSILSQWGYISLRYPSIFQAFENTYVDIARNRIVVEGMDHAEQTYGRKPDFFLFIDADSVIGLPGRNGSGYIRAYPQYVDQLIARDVDIVSGYYVKKRDAFAQMPVFGLGKANDYFLFNDSAIPDDLLEVDWVGGGYLLVKRGVFEEIKPPWFENKYEQPTPQGYLRVGEDISFCRKVKEHGFKIHVDLRVKIGHHGSTAWPPMNIKEEIIS